MKDRSKVRPAGMPESASRDRGGAAVANPSTLSDQLHARTRERRGRLSSALDAVAQDPTDEAERDAVLDLAAELGIAAGDLESQLSLRTDQQRLRDALAESGSQETLRQQLREAGAELQDCELAERARRQAFVAEHSRLTQKVDRARAAIERRTATERELHAIERKIEEFRDPEGLSEKDRRTREDRLRSGHRIDLRRRREEVERELRSLNQGRFAPVDSTPEGVAAARRHFEQQLATIDAELQVVTP